ncbi:MAG: ATP12 family protein [Pseudomonadota bacterium]
MRDIFEEIFENQPLDPTEAARRNMRPKLRARFYKEAAVSEAADGFHVLLDGRAVRTPARRPLAAPTRALAELIAVEWQAQQDAVDPATMPLTRLANSIIDGVAAQPQPVREEIEKYLGTDLLFYRAEGPEGLLASQAKHWDPLVAWARDAHGARFVMAQGVIHAKQPADAMAAMAKVIPSDSWALGAVNVITTLTGSALIALALAAGRITPDEAWAIAHVDEDWNMETWGRDEMALQRRNFRRLELDAAADVLRLAR